MSRTYRATGINLKSMPMGESDRLLTILTREWGLIRAIAMGARKHNSRMAGRSGLFVTNDLMLARGKSLDKITQAETLASYPGLSQDLKKLTASQYLAELVLAQALSDQPQEDLFDLLSAQLAQLARSPDALVLAHLLGSVLQLLALAGIAPQVTACCLTQMPLLPDPDTPDGGPVGFHIAAGGTINLAALEQVSPAQGKTPLMPGVSRLPALELELLQQLVEPATSELEGCLPDVAPEQVNAYPVEIWLAVERLLRQYAQHHFDRPIRSGNLIETCFAPALAL